MQLLSNILDTDSYKFSHWKQYPPETTSMFSYLESRGGRYDKTVFFGLQYYLQEYLSKKITRDDVVEAAAFAKLHGEPFNEKGWLYIVDELDGKLPIKIRAVTEGAVVPTGNILMSVESTDPKAFWVVSWVETMLVRLWFPITVATQAWHIKKKLKQGLELTSDDPAGELPFKLHCFGSRGVSSRESAMIGGAAHLVNFMGSDTVAGVWMANKHYDHKMAGFSIPAAEHSTMTMWEKAGEAMAYANMLEQYKDQPIFACVSDSYDIHNAVSNIWGGELKKQVIEYEGTLVVRPDSGDPRSMVLDVLDRLEDAFGSTRNSKGYKVLNHGVRVIQGDGVNEKSIAEIVDAMIDAGYSITNIAFGMGGAGLQRLDRDTQRFAFKCSHAEVGGRSVDVYKDPASDSGKRSKRGLLELVQESSGRVRTARRGEKKESLLEDVFMNGEILRTQSFSDVRKNSEFVILERYKGWIDRPV